MSTRTMLYTGSMYRNLLIVGVVLIGIHVKCSGTTKSIRQLIWRKNRLREAASILEEHGLSSYFEQSNITAFVPSTECFLAFNDTKFGYNLRDRASVMSLMLYHIGSGVVKTENIQDGMTLASKHPSRYKLRLNIFHDGKQKIYTVNGASLIVTDIIASNGILHIIDTVLAPVMSPKTLHDYTIYPDMPGLEFISISRVSTIINPELKKQTNSTDHQFTSFAPHDNVLFPMPAYGQDKLFGDIILLNATILSHIVPNHVNFIPTKGRIPEMQSLHGTLRFSRENGNVYVTNHMVRAKITHFNIPVINGVMHVLDNLLYFIYKDVVQTIKSTKETSVFAAYLDKIPLSYLSLLQSLEKNFTIFIPTNDAFANLPTRIQQDILSDQQLLTEVVGGHIISSEMMDSTMWINGKQWKTINNKTLQVKSSSGELYLQLDDIKATIIRKDIGCTNGILHLISHVLTKSTFSVSDAIKGNPQLSYMKQYLEGHPELEQLIETGYGMGHITVFVPSDQIMKHIPDQAKSILEQNPAMLNDAIRGHIIQTEAVSTIGLYGNVLKYTLAGTKLELKSDGDAFVVVGNYVSAKIIKKNIWCSNGVLHIIDNLLHIPLRNVLDEISQHSEISFISSFLHLDTMKELSSALQEGSNDFTLFIPINSAFSSIPRSRADTLLANTSLLQQVLKAHISSNGSRYANEMIDGDMYPAEEEVLHVSRNSSHVFITNNNVRSTVIKSNIRAMNGVIHIVDSLLYFPYYTVAEMMYETDILRSFYDMIRNVPEFLQWSGDEQFQMTVFAPSSKYLKSIPSDQLSAITADPLLLRKIFMDHVIIGARLDSKFLRQNLQQKYILKTRYNSTFTLQRTNSVFGTLIDVGYSNKQLPLDVDRDGIACSNGVIFPVHGFLDYSFHNVIEEMQIQEKLKVSLDQILKVFPEEVQDEFRDMDQKFTIFMPADEAFLHLSYYEATQLNALGNSTEKYEILNRHIMNGSLMTVHKLESMLDKTLPNTNVFVKKNVSEYYLEWEGIHAKIIQPNILAQNGIIHILDRVLFTAVEPTTSAPGKTGASSINSAIKINVNLNSFAVLTILLWLLFTES